MRIKGADVYYIRSAQELCPIVNVLCYSTPWACDFSISLEIERERGQAADEGPASGITSSVAVILGMWEYLLPSSSQLPSCLPQLLNGSHKYQYSSHPLIEWEL